jgi:hypothetical protein
MQTSPESQDHHKTKTHFPFLRWVLRKLTGRWARRICLAVLFLLLLTATANRLRSYFMARRINAVLRGLSQVRLDQTTEEQMTRMVPYLVKKEWEAGGTSHRGYYVSISNDAGQLPRIAGITLTEIRSEELMLCFEHIADWLGYRFINFDAGVLVQDDKVSQVEYGLNQYARPQYAGYIGYLVSARSVHGFWLPRQKGFEVSSVDDFSPQYRPRRWGNTLSVIYTPDAPPETTKRVFDLDLACFWRFRGCEDAADVAPGISDDVQRIQKATYRQLIFEKCPDSIVEGRMRYLPDISILLLEVTGSRRVEVNEEGGWAEDWLTDYKLREVIRGQNSGSWKNVRFRPMIPSPTDPTRQIANQIWPATKIGSQVLYFGGLGFDSCRFIPATPSALEIVRNTPVPMKRAEDQIPRGLL